MTDDEEQLPTPYEWNRDWRHRNPDQRNAERSRNYAQSRTPESQEGRTWTVDEDRLIVEHKKTDREIAAELGRTVQAIQQRRFKIKRHGQRAKGRKFTAAEVITTLAELNADIATTDIDPDVYRAVVKLIKDRIDSYSVHQASDAAEAGPS